VNKVPTTISPQDLDTLLKGSEPFALIDVRETGEYNNAHIPDASLIPRRDLESQMGVRCAACRDARSAVR